MLLLRMFKDECNVRHFRIGHNVPEEFTTCFWQDTRGTKSYWLAYRIAMTLFYIGTMLFIFFEERGEEDQKKFFIFLTNWTYLAQTLTFAYAFGIVLERFLKERKNQFLPAMVKLPLAYRIFYICYIAVAGASMVVTVVYWLYIFKAETFTNPLHTLTTHLLNLLFMLLDFFLVAFPIRLLHFYVPIIYLLIYAIFTVIYQLSGGTGKEGNIPIYHILDWRDAYKAGMTVLIVFVAVVLSHLSFCLIQALKQYLRKMPAVEYPKPEGIITSEPQQPPQRRSEPLEVEQRKRKSFFRKKPPKEEAKEEPEATV